MESVQARDHDTHCSNSPECKGAWCTAELVSSTSATTGLQVNHVPTRCRLLSLSPGLLPSLTLHGEALFFARLALARVAKVTKLAIDSVLATLLVEEGARLACTPPVQR